MQVTPGPRGASPLTRTGSGACMFPASPIVCFHVNIFHQFLSNAPKTQMLLAAANFFFFPELKEIKCMARWETGGRCF